MDGRTVGITSMASLFSFIFHTRASICSYEFDIMNGKNYYEKHECGRVFFFVLRIRTHHRSHEALYK